MEVGERGSVREPKTAKQPDIKKKALRKDKTGTGRPEQEANHQ